MPSPHTTPMRVRAAILSLLLLAASAQAQQVPDTTFDTSVARPAYTANGPKVLLDEAHHNFHTSTGRYRPFAELLRHDGYRVTPNAKPFSAETLNGYSVLVIANALGVDNMADPAAANDAFTQLECDVVRAWVHDGGSLFLIADHVPMGAAARTLAQRFNVGMRSGYTVDPIYGDRANPLLIAYSMDHGLATGHPVITGRDSTEVVRRVVAFAGQSLSGPSESNPVLSLSEKAEDLMVPFGSRFDHVTPDQRRTAVGRSQALSLRYGRGRVFVAGEAAMFSAQLVGPPGPDQPKMGMNVPGNDDRQFTLNIMHWLSGLLDAPAPAHGASAVGAGAAAGAATVSAGAVPHPSAAIGAPLAGAPAAADSAKNVTPARLIHLVDPYYPPDARRRGIDGTVYVSVYVRADSAVTDARILAGAVAAQPVDQKYARKLDAAAVGAVRQSRFAPAMSDGKPVDSWITVPVTFKAY